MTQGTDPAVLVVGAGPAGVSCAMWLDDFGVPFEWVDTDGRIGGMLTRVHNRISNYPGGDYEDGRALADALGRPLQDRGLRPQSSTVTRLRPRADHVTAQLDRVDTRRFELVVLATGTSYRTLDVPGETEGMESECVSQSASAHGAKFAGRDVAVVGGGDAGFENALVLAQHGCRVTMLLRSTDFRARPAFVQAVREHPSIEISSIPSVIKRIEPTGDGCRLHVNRVDQTTTLKVAALFVRIGVDPVVPPGCDELDTDDEGYLVVDTAGYTSDNRILAAGDITHTPLPSVAVAVGEGATVAHSCASELGFVSSSTG